jgi:hypothetical protein
MDVFVELVVREGAPGLAVDADMRLLVIAVTRCCLEAFFVKGARGCVLLGCGL